ncbi:MAG: VOC family protein [Cytophagales bacterium]|nr:VOC family protein [Bernardetiaceae bacterium]MDW8209625.1 VOC family protein [Cytophagales bacterium]
MPFQLFPYSEVVFSVGSIEKAAATYRHYMGWQVVHQAEGDYYQPAFWQLPQGCTLDEMLLRLPGTSETGQIRLVKFHSLKQEYIRPGGQPWDTGGYLDIDLRVNDIQQVCNHLREMGWHSIGNPVQMQMGPFLLEEVLMKGHDEIVIALVHRISPSQPIIEGGKHIVSNVYLSAMIVKDFEQSVDFFVNKLGFQLLNRISVCRPTPGPTIFGLPYNIAPQAPANLAIISPDGSRNHMLDVIKIDNITGEDFSQRALPPNRGILMFRFPVKGIEDYARFVQQNGVNLQLPLTSTCIAPYGEVKAFAVRSPDGCWLEFFEKV